MIGAGLKKCMPTTRSGGDAADARAVTDSDEVLVASTHSSSTVPDRVSNSSRLSDTDSGAASITRSQEANPSSESTASRRSCAWSASS